jgi:galactoside O-acetyltransferase
MADKIHTGEIYFSNGEAMIACQNQCLEPLCNFTKTHPSEMEKRQALMKQMFVEVSGGRYLEPWFHANWGGAHVHLGDNIYANFNDCGIDPSLL